ncbi:hypothetical protein ACWC0A_27050 [Streptomyces scopuliridis]
MPDCPVSNFGRTVRPRRPLLGRARADVLYERTPLGIALSVSQSTTN